MIPANKIWIIIICTCFHYYLIAEQKVQSTLNATQQAINSEVEAKRNALIDAKNKNVNVNKRRQLMLEYAKALQIKQKHQAAIQQGK